MTDTSTINALTAEAAETNGEHATSKPESEADARLRGLVGSFVDQADSAVGRYASSLQADMLGPLRIMFERAAESHRDARSEVPDTDENPEAVWRAIRSYREKVHAEIVVPLLAVLEAERFGDLPQSRYGRLVEDLSRHCSSLPVEVAVPSPDRLFAPNADDSLPRRVAKAGRRFDRSVRRFLTRATDLPDRSVRLRALAAAHVRSNIKPTVLALEKTIIDAVVACLSKLDEGLAKWTQAVLNLESEYDRSDYHDPLHLTWPAARTESTDNPDKASGGGVPQMEPREEPANVQTGASEKLNKLADDLDSGLEAASGALGGAEVRHQQSIPWDELTDHVDLAGTGLERRRRLKSELGGSESAIDARYEPFRRWLDQVRDRITLSAALLGLREQMLRWEEDLVERMSRGSLGSVLRAFRQMQQRFSAAQNEIEDASDRASNVDNMDAYRETIASIKSRLSSEMEAEFRSMPGVIASDRDVVDPGEPEWEEAKAAVEKVPEMLEVHGIGGGLDSLSSARRVNLASVVKDVMVTPVPERLREHTRPLQKQIVKALSDSENVIQIVQFNFDTALEELDAVDDEEKEGVVDVEAHETKHDAAVRGARELTVDALVRASESIDETLLEFQEPWSRFLNGVFGIFHGDWTTISRRTRSDEAMHGQWQSYATRASRVIENKSRSLRESWRTFVDRLGRISRIGRRRAKALIRKGQSAVGVIERADEDRSRTIEAITSAAKIHQDLPLVYRKLFAFEPVTEPTLLEGRSRDLVSTRTHFSNWSERRSDGILILESPLGSGRSSFLSVLCARVFENARVCRLTLKTRVLTEEGVVELIAGSIGDDSAAADIKTLDDIEGWINREGRQKPVVFIIDNLEHLMLRAQGGTALLEKLLVFMTHTDSAAYWVATIGKEAWNYLDRASGLASSFAAAYSLAPIDRDGIEALIVNRHRRSGLLLRFSNPDKSGKPVRGRFGRELTQEQIQAKLRTQYFDALHKASGQNIMLALFYWLRSSDFASEDGVLVVNPIRPLSFNFLTNIDAQAAFTLKTFLIHNTLTIDEHSRIFRMAESRSIFVLEALLNQYLIEPVNGDSTHNAADRIRADRIRVDVPYRIRPLVIHPITEFLRRRHIIY